MGKQCCWFGLRFKPILVLIGLAILRFESVSAGKNLGEARQNSSRKRNVARTIKSEDGDVIDCVDIYKQPAFKHPALKNHTIQTGAFAFGELKTHAKTPFQMTPSLDPKMEEDEESDEHSSVTATSQLWHKRGRCPEGTVPIRRNRFEEVSRTISSEASIRKKPILQPIGGRTDVHIMQPNHSKAIVITLGYSYHGIKGDIGVWNPKVEYDDEYSTSRVSLLSGPRDDLETVEAGWMVNPSLYGDRKTRLFVYWTEDGSKKTGCFDLTCPGFVQTSKDIALGAAIYPISTFRGLPSQITLYIFQDSETGNWWLQYGEKTMIGYWPQSLFGTLRHHAESAEWGGEVYSSRIESYHPHTGTAMGNGKFADYVYWNSGWVKRMRILDNSLVLKKPGWAYNHVDEDWCYRGFYLEDYVDDPLFFFGGPGRNPTCP